MITGKHREPCATRPPSMRPLRFWAETFALLLTICCVFEVISRLVINDTPEILINPRYGPITEPNHVQLQSNEGWARNRTNELGNVDDPMPNPLPVDGILAVGDSFTQADQVPMKSRFTDLLDKKLQRRVYNAGHGSWSLINQVEFLRAELPTYSPAAIVVQVSGNDLKEMSKKSQAHFVEGPDGSFAISVPRPRNSALHDLVMTRSAFVRRMVQRIRSILFKRGEANDTSNNEMSIPPIVERSLPLLMADLRKLHRDVVVLYLPTLDYFHGCIDRWENGRVLFETTSRAVAIPFIDATPAICARFSKTRQPLHGFWNTVPGKGHMNTDGHKVVAELLARHFRVIAQ